MSDQTMIPWLIGAAIIVVIFYWKEVIGLSFLFSLVFVLPYYLGKWILSLGWLK